MKNGINKIARVSIMAGLAMGLASAGSSLYGSSQTSPLGDSGSSIGGINPLPGTSGKGSTSNGGTGSSMGGAGLGGSGIGLDTSFGKAAPKRRADSLSVIPYGGPGTGIPSAPSNGINGAPTGGTANPNSKGIGGSGGVPGMDSIHIVPKDSKRPADTIGAPEWNERG